MLEKRFKYLLAVKALRKRRAVRMQTYQMYLWAHTPTSMVVSGFTAADICNTKYCNMSTA